MGLHFEWDRRKAFENGAKHGVTFVEAKTVFADPLAVIVEDDRHSRGEVRQAVFGVSDRGRHLAVMFTVRGSAFRIISARVMTSRERREYEEGDESNA
jgi:uncharacterized DUF497 family protein